MIPFSYPLRAKVRIRILFVSLYLVHMRENTDQNNSEYGHFLRSYSCREKGIFKESVLPLL